MRSRLNALMAAQIVSIPKRDRRFASLRILLHDEERRGVRIRKRAQSGKMALNRRNLQHVRRIAPLKRI